MFRLLSETGAKHVFPTGWLDEQACADIRRLNSPCISVEALTRLRRLLDAQPLLRRVKHGTGKDIPQAPAEYASTNRQLSILGLKEEPPPLPPDVRQRCVNLLSLLHCVMEGEIAKEEKADER